MSKVWFRCDHKNATMFILNSCKELDYIPLIGDIIKPWKSDFTKASFRVKPYFKEKNYKEIKDCVHLDFKVVSRSYDLLLNEWELICEPLSKTLIYLLKQLKVK